MNLLAFSIQILFKVSFFIVPFTEIFWPVKGKDKENVILSTANHIITTL